MLFSPFEQFEINIIFSLFNYKFSSFILDLTITNSTVYLFLAFSFVI